MSTQNSRQAPLKNSKLSWHLSGYVEKSLWAYIAEIVTALSLQRNRVLYTRIRVFLKPPIFFIHESTFRLHETSESADWNCIFLRPISRVV